MGKGSVGCLWIILNLHLTEGTVTALSLYSQWLAGLSCIHMSASAHTPLTPAVGSSRPAAAWQALHRPSSNQSKALVTGELTTGAQAAVIISSPR